MKKYFSTFFALLCLFMLVVCMGVSAVSTVSSSTLYSRVLRLHVIANSDSKEDQEIKLKVRDGLLVTAEELFGGCENVGQALEIANSNKRLLEDTARRVLEDNKSDKDVKIVIGKEMYPKKKYGKLTFPEGEYLSVRVLIGEGKGKNWWCVLFPPLCTSGYGDEGRVLESYGIDSECVKQLEEENANRGINIFGCNVRLKFLEYFD